jgi:hypothetical protein
VHSALYQTTLSENAVYIGVAAGTLLNGLTIHSCYYIKVVDDYAQNTNEYQEELTAERVSHLLRVKCNHSIPLS